MSTTSINMLAYLVVLTIPLICVVGIPIDVSEDGSHSAVRKTRSSKPVECPKGFKDMDGICYRLVHGTTGRNYKLFNQARDSCAVMGGYLAEPRSQAQFDNLAKYCRDLKLDLYYEMYLGATDREKEGTWKWESDGTTVKQFWWAYGQPKHEDVYGGLIKKTIKGDCLVMRIIGSKNDWYVKPCDQMPRPYLCQSLGVLKLRPIHTYKVFLRYSRTFQEANIECEQAGMVMAEPKTKQDNDFIYSIARTRAKETKYNAQKYIAKFWIGVTKRHEVWTYHSTGDTVSFTPPWNTGQPRLGSNYVAVGLSDSSNWSSEMALRMHGVVCQTKDPQPASRQVLRPGFRDGLIRCDVTPKPPTLSIKWRLPSGKIWYNRGCTDSDWGAAECIKSRKRGHCNRANVKVKCHRSCYKCDVLKTFVQGDAGLSVTQVTKERAGVYTCIAQHYRRQTSEFSITVDVRYEYEDATNDGCPPSIFQTDGEWTFSKENSKCYGTDHELAPNFGQAEIWCRDRGAHLVMPKTALEITHVQTASNSFKFGKSVIWAGLDDIPIDRDWKWADGSKVEGTSLWASITENDERSTDKSISKDCGTLNLTSRMIGIENCVDRRSFLCETSSLYWSTSQRQTVRCPFGLANFECGGFCYWLSIFKGQGHNSVMGQVLNALPFPWTGDAALAFVETSRQKRDVALLLLGKYTEGGDNKALIHSENYDCKTLNYRGELARGRCSSEVLFAVQTTYAHFPEKDVCRAKWLAGDRKDQMNDIGAVPWMAMVFFGKDLASADPCTATIIGVKWLITSADCMYDAQDVQRPVSSMTVMSGSTQIRYGNRNYVKHVIIHPGYKAGEKNVDADIAILETKSSNAFVCPTAIPLCPLAKGDNFNKCFLSGFGDATTMQQRYKDDTVTSCRIEKPNNTGKSFRLSSGCPNGFTNVNQTCFWLYSVTKQWHIRSHSQAQYNCKLLGGFLSEPRTEALYNKMLAYLSGLGYNNTHPPPTIHLGANDLALEGTWRWNSDAGRMVFSRWAAGEPSSRGANEDCLVYVHKARSVGLHFADRPCSSKYRFMCQASAEDVDKDSFVKCPVGTWRGGSPLVCKDGSHTVRLVGVSQGFNADNPAYINVTDVTSNMDWIRNIIGVNKKKTTHQHNSSELVNKATPTFDTVVAIAVIICISSQYII